MKKSLHIFAGIILLMLLFSCGTIPFIYKTSGSQSPGPVPYPDARFFVITDIHLCLFPEGRAEKVSDKFQKLLADSKEIHDQAEAIIDSMPGDFVIVPGDLTEFGEFTNHKGVAAFFARIEARGKQVFAIPGNHDVSNYTAKLSPTSDSERPISASEFEEIYSDFGFDEVLLRDPDSLSYVAEPVPGLWLLGLDSCRYDEQSEKNPTVTEGRLRRGTMEWAERALIRANLEKKAVIAFMHHNLVEHFTGQKKYFGDYVVADNEEITRMLAHYGARLVFTGHYHAQDIAKTTVADKNDFLFDVETGSLVSYPSPIRSVRIDAESQKAFFTTTLVSATASHPVGFQAYAKEQLRQTLIDNSAQLLKRYGMSETDALAISGEAADGYISHSAGDEDPKLSTWNPYVAGCFYGCTLSLFISDLGANIWNDLPPPDNNLVIDLVTGEWDG